MDSDLFLSDIVVFDFVSEPVALELVRRLRGWREAWAEPRFGGGCHVGVVLDRAPGDLAVLLRDVRGWLAYHRLPAVAFQLDGRTYRLDACPTVARAVAAA